MASTSLIALYLLLRAGFDIVILLLVVVFVIGDGLEKLLRRLHQRAVARAQAAAELRKARGLLIECGS